jgi:uncharacterized membrane protein
MGYVGGGGAAMRHDPRFDTAIPERVRAIEARTDAEIVVAVVPASYDVQRLAERAASVGALAVAAVLFYAPFAVHEASALLEIAVMWFVLRAVAQRVPSLWLRFVPASAVRAAVEQRAARAFLEEAVHGTPHRTGVLVLWSAAEREIAVRVDLGIEGRVPHGALDPIIDGARVRSLDDLLGFLDALGTVLAQHAPAHAESDAVNLSDAPRVLA